MQTKFLPLAEGKIAYDDSGSGPLVLCVPGMGVTRAEFRYLTPRLVEAGYRVVSVDLRGHGETCARWADYSVAGMSSDIIALIRHLDSGPVILLGHSISGSSVVRAATDAPELVRGLLLVDAGFQHTEISKAFRLLLRVLFARPWGPAAWIQYYTGLFPSRKPADWKTYVAALRANLSEPGRLEALHQMMISDRYDSAERLARVAAPALMIMGARDSDFKNPEAEARWVAEQCGGTYQMIEDSGHYPFTEYPELTLPVILNFLARLQAEESHAAISR
jgi:pimeloyl-ACP methyl ester carboxylesterase